MRHRLSAGVICGLLWAAMASPAEAIVKDDRAHQPHQPVRSTRGRTGPMGGAPRYVAGEILVKFKAVSATDPDAAFDSKLERSRRTTLHNRVGGVVLREFGYNRAELVQLPAGLRVEDGLRLYGRDPMVEVAEPNYIVSVANTANDTWFTSQWALFNTGQVGGRPGADIGIRQAWNITTGTANVAVVVIDSGIDYQHPDLAPNVWTNPGETPGDGVDNDGNGYVDDTHGIDVVSGDGDPVDDHGHGTHVAGIIGAAGNNNAGVAGVNWQVQIIGCKFLDANGFGTNAGMIRCLEYVRALRDHGVNVVATNNSYGGANRSDLVEAAIRAQRDVLFVAAAGNDGYDNDRAPFYPASYDLPNVLAVSATDSSDQHPSWSNRGRTTVAISAPGSEILSLRAAGTDLYHDGAHFFPFDDPNAQFYVASGTSMAAPHVAGLAALLKAQHPALEWSGIRNLILAGGDPISALDMKTMTGRRINAYRSLTCTDRPLIVLMDAPRTFPLPAGVPATFSVLSINCQSPVGNVLATPSSGAAFELRDDGAAPDAEAGDGVFTATFVPSSDTPYVSFASPAGQTGAPRLSIDRYLPQATSRVAYDHTLTAADGTAPFTWSIVSGALPVGLQLDRATGRISGLPRATGSFYAGIHVVDSLARTATADVVLRVADDRLVETFVARDRSTHQTVPQAMSLDADGNTVVTGYYVNPDNGEEDIFVKKYDPSGRLIWERYRDSNTPWWSNWGTAVAVDASGAIYVTGGYVWFHSDSDYMLIKYDADGNELWSKRYRYSDYDYAIEVPWGATVDAEGNVIVTGRSTPFGTLGSTQALTVKFAPSGDVIWAHKFQERLLDAGFDVAADADGNIIVAGSSGAVFDAAPGFTTYTHGFLTLKYDPDGEVLWSRIDSAPGWSLQGARAVALDREGSIYVGGIYGATLYKFDSNGGLLWQQTVAVDETTAYVTDLAVDQTGNVAFGGEAWDFRLNAWVLVAGAFDAEGAPVWARRLSVGVQGGFASLAVDEANHVRASFPDDGGVLLTSFATRLFLKPAQLPPGFRGDPYSQQLHANGGSLPYGWRVTSGALPAGVTLDPASGLIEGVPVEGGTFRFTATVTSADGATASQDLAIGVGYVEVISGWLDAGVTGTPYRYVLDARGTAAPFNWRLMGGKLPPGLRLDGATGVVSGTPTTPGDYQFTVVGTDTEHHQAQGTFMIIVADPLVVVTTTLPAAAVETLYSSTLQASGGRAPYYWFVTSGAVPLGLALDYGGELAGTPTETGTFEFVVTAYDSVGQSKEQPLSLVVK